MLGHNKGQYQDTLTKWLKFQDNFKISGISEISGQPGPLWSHTGQKLNYKNRMYKHIISDCQSDIHLKLWQRIQCVLQVTNIMSCLPHEHGLVGGPTGSLTHSTVANGFLGTPSYRVMVLHVSNITVQMPPIGEEFLGITGTVFYGLGALHVIKPTVPKHWQKL